MDHPLGSAQILLASGLLTQTMLVSGLFHTHFSGSGSIGALFGARVRSLFSGFSYFTHYLSGERIIIRLYPCFLGSWSILVSSLSASLMKVIFARPSS